MLSYKLAKQLKDAGFPFREVIDDNEMTIRGLEKNQLGMGFSFGDGKSYFEPTLSELIKECGDGLNALIRKDKTIWVADGGKWIGGFYGNEFCIIGKTPEEAVAKLYLKIKK